MDLNKLLRKNISSLTPYSSARDEYTGEALVYLDANENPFNQPYNRYPDPLQLADGFDVVVVNGTVARENGALQSGLHGRVLAPE